MRLGDVEGEEGGESFADDGTSESIAGSVFDGDVAGGRLILLFGTAETAATADVPRFKLRHLRWMHFFFLVTR